MKVILQTLTAIVVFLINIFREKMPRKRFWILLICTVTLLIINGILMYKDYKNAKQESFRLSKKISELDAKVNRLNQQIANLIKLLKGVSIAELKGTDSYIKVEKMYDSVINLINQGDQKKAVHKLLELRKIAAKKRAYKTAAISSLIASYVFESAGEKIKAAQLQSEAGDFFIKLNRFGEAKVWKKNAKELYEKQGLTTEAMNLDREIKTLELRLK